MTPPLLSLVTHALQVCLDRHYYVTRTGEGTSQFMCHAFQHAADDGALDQDAAWQAQQFLSRWIRWQGYCIGERTNAMAIIDRHLKQQTKVITNNGWFDEGHGIVCYQQVILRLQEKAARRQS